MPGHRSMLSTVPLVVAATDLTAGSQRSSTFAAQLAAALGGELHVVHASDVASDPIWEGTDAAIKPYVEQLQQRIAERVAKTSAALEVERQRCSQIGVSCRAELVPGRPWESLLEYAKSHNADFIVVGPHGAEPGDFLLGGIRQRMLGSTADRLVRHAPCPVWVVPPGSEAAPFAKWMVAVDFSPCSNEAVQLAHLLAHRTGGSLALVHVTSPADVPDSEVPEPARWPQALHEATRKQAAQDLAKLAAGLQDVKVSQHVRPRWSRLHLELLEEAKEQSTSVLVMGSHGRKGIRQLVLGSVAERALRVSSIPILVTREP